MLVCFNDKRDFIFSNILNKYTINILHSKFINAVIVNLKLFGHECHTNINFFGYAMYADDLIMISAS